MSNNMPAYSLSRGATLAVIALGSLGTLAPPLQPLLLGQLAAEGRISLAQIGQAAMLEGLGMALAASVAGFRLKHENLRLIAALGIIIAIFANLVTPHLSGLGLTTTRILGGISAGLLAWVWVGMLARHHLPARLCAIYILIQSSILMLLSYAYSIVIFTWGGALAGYAVLAAINAASLLLILFLPNAYAPLPSTQRLALPSGLGLVGLVAVILHFAAVMALWVYIVPLARRIDFSAEGAGTVVSIALGAQLAGGLAAGVIAGRLAASKLLLGGLTISLISAGWIGLTGSQGIFTVCTAVFAFLWVFVGSFQMPYLTLIDPERRAAMQLPAAQLLGMAAGPAIASLIVTLWGVPAVVVGSCLIFGLCLVLMVGTLVMSRPKGMPGAIPLSAKVE